MGQWSYAAMRPCGAKQTSVCSRKTKNWVIPYATVTVFAAFFGLVLPVNYLLLVRHQLLFACLYRDDRSLLLEKANQFMSIQFQYESLSFQRNGDVICSISQRYLSTVHNIFDWRNSTLDVYNKVKYVIFSKFFTFSIMWILMI